MKLPNGVHAVADERKLREYVLNLGHPVGGHHAVLFLDLLEITEANWTDLRDELLRVAQAEDVTAGKASPSSTRCAGP